MSIQVGNAPAMPTSAASNSQVLIDGRSYLERYWDEAHLDDEDKFVLRFCHEAYCSEEFRDIFEDRSRPRVLVEVGGGPVVDKYLTAPAVIDKIYHLEPSDSARAEVHKFKGNLHDAFDWNLRFSYASELPSCQPLPENNLIDTLKERLRDCISYLGPLDLHSDAPMSAELPLDISSDRVAVVSSHSCVECITTTRAEFDRVLAKIVSVCPVGGLLVMTFNTNTDGWSGGVAQRAIGAHRVTDGEVHEALKVHGFGRFKLVPHRSQGEETEMSSTLGVAAVRERIPTGGHFDDLSTWAPTNSLRSE